MSTSAAHEPAWQADEYNRHASFVSKLGRHNLELLSPHAGERVLDLGCGSGEIAKELQELGCHVIGVDSAPDMVTATKSKGVEAHVMDGQKLELAASSFDAVFSNAALHWMSDNPSAVAAHVFACLKPGGRFVGEFGGHGNLAAIQTALAYELRRYGVDFRNISPWYFPTADEYRELLGDAGFAVDIAETFPRPVVLETGMAHWLEVFASGIISHVPDEHRAQVQESILENLAPGLQDRCGKWTADYVRVRFRAKKPTRS